MAVKDNRTEGRLSPICASGLALGSAVAGTVTGWIIYSNLGIDHNVPLPPALPATRRVFTAPDAGCLNVYEDTAGDGAPLVLIHSVNAAASAYEVRPLFRYYSAKRPAYALDLPGYGFSERTNRIYTPDLFIDAILALLHRTDEPADVVALSLSSEFAAEAARQAPEQFHSLTMVSPTGFGIAAGTQDRQMSMRKSYKAHRRVTFPIWSRPLFDLLTTRVSIKYFLQKSFLGAVPSDLIDYAYATSHQSGAEHAPLAFISGMLRTPEVRSRIYDKLEIPVLVLYDEDAYVRFDNLPTHIRRHPNWQAQRISPTRGLPHFEELEETTQALNDFWSGL